jgi:hypothetical protein
MHPTPRPALHAQPRSVGYNVHCVGAYLHPWTNDSVLGTSSINSLPETRATLKELSFGLVLRVHEYARGLQIAVSDRGGRHVVAMIKLEDIE